MHPLLQNDKRTSYRKPLALSLLLHAAVIALILAALIWQNRQIDKQEEDFIAQLKASEQEKAETEQKARLALQHELAMSQVEMEFADILSDDVQSQTLELLQEQSQLTLRELFERARDENLSEEQLNAIRLEILDKLESTANAQLLEAIVNQIRNYIHEDIAPKAVREMEQSLHGDGHNVLKEVARFMDRKKAALEDRTILNEALPAIHPAMAAKLEKDIQEKFVPEATKKILDTFQEEIKALPVDHKELRELIAEDVLAAMKAEMQKSQPQEEMLTFRSRVEFGLTDGSKAAEINEKASKFSARLQAVLHKQQEARQHSDPEEAAKLQSTLSTELRQLHKEAAELAHEARINTVDHTAWRIGGLAQAASQAYAVEASIKAAGAFEQDFPEEARREQDNALQLTSRMVEPAAVTQEVMAREETTQQEKAARKQTVPVTPEIRENAAELAKALDQQLTQASHNSVQKALKEMRPRQVLGQEFNTELQAALEMQQKLASARERMAEGRELGGERLQLQASAMRPGSGGIPPNHLSTHHFNREAYEAFVKDLKNRTEPGNAYGNVGETEGLATKATQEPGELPAYVYLPPSPKKSEPEPEAKREVPKPPFKSIDFAAAPMQNKGIKIDGDLSDWGELTHPITMKWYADNEHQTFEGGTPLYMRWAPEGLYFAYRVEGSPNPRVPHFQSAYSGDVLEIWLDMKNSRDTSMQESQFAHQFILSPFGLQGSTGTYVEFGRGARGLTPGKSYVDEKDVKGMARGKRDGGGYTVEAFIAAGSLAKPVLIPGTYLAANFSINRGTFGGKYATQWSASKAIGTHLKPDTWGDILLLGTDATLRFIDKDDPARDISYLIVGEPVHVEISDRDMNMRPDLIDRIPASLLTARGGAPLLVILEETGPDTGVFRASANTQAFFKEAKPATLNVRQGDTITLEYEDARAAYGEANRVTRIELPVAWAVYAGNSN